MEERLVVQLAGVAPERGVSLGKVLEEVASLVLGSMKQEQQEKEEAKEEEEEEAGRTKRRRERSP